MSIRAALIRRHYSGQNTRTLGRRRVVKFMVIRRADKRTEAGVLPTTELIDAMMRYHKDMEDAGIQALAR